MIEYKITPIYPEAHLFEVVIKLPATDKEEQVLSLPAWILGSYMIRDFAKNIVTIEAASAGQPVPIEKLDKQTWRLSLSGAEVVVTYQVYAWDLSVRSAHLDTTHAYFNGTSLFLRAHGYEHDPCRVEIQPPAGDDYKQWRVATTLTPLTAEHLGFGIYTAKDYDELIDHPVEMGLFDYAEFMVAGVPHGIAITGRHTADMERLCSDLKVICEHHVKFFGELPEMERYLFQVMAVGDGYGGLEHRTSTSLLCKRSDLPQQGVAEVTNGYRQFLGLASHEYFHLWNVKRIRPEVFKQADLSKEVHTGLLWAFEGITSYYDDLSLVRTGLIAEESYLELLAQVITRVMRGSGRHKQTISESSFDAWTKFYKQDENAPNAIVSYYAKGALVALTLDLTIRRQSGGEKCLDDVMRALWQEYGRVDRGVGEYDIEQLAERVTGLDLKGFFDAALRSTEELPLEDLLRDVGVGYGLRAAKSSDDQGGVRKAETQASAAKVVLGARYSAENGEPRLTVVLDGGAAQHAGLSAGDVIVAVDGIRATPANLHELVAAHKPGSRMELHAFRRDELMVFDLPAMLAPEDTCDLWLLEDVDPLLLERRRDWLGIGRPCSPPA